MTLRSRFLLVGFGAIVFALITPVIVLYALGYQLDIENKQIVKTGSLVIKTEPQNAEVYVDDIKKKDKTNNTYRFIRPGDYTIRIDKPNYQSWTKRLNIASSLVTWGNQDREFITLFWQKPIQVSNHQVALSAVSLPNKDAILVKNNLSYEFDPEEGNLKELSNPAPVFNQPTEILNSEIYYYFYRFPTARVFSQEQLAMAKHLEANDSYAAVLVGNVLYHSNKGVATKFAEGVSAFTLENDHLWYIEGSFLKHANLTVGAVETMTTLPYSPFNSRVIRGDLRIFLILDGTLYALNDKLEKINNNVSTAYWDDKTKRLVASNSNEIILFDPNSFKSELILRSSSEIAQPTINGHTGYIFFINENSVKAIELDGRDHRNVYTIYDAPAQQFLLSSDGKVLSIFSDTNVSVLEIRD